MLLESEPGFEVVAEAGELDQIAPLVEDTTPDVLLLDVHMRGGASLDLIPDLAERTRVVVLTMQDDPGYARTAMRAGARGYVLKDAEAEEVAAAVRAAYAGEVHLDPAVARLLAQRMRAKKSPDEELAEPLTDREKDVLRLLGQGMSNKEIGTELFITERTARTYVSNILGKLGLASRTQAALYAVEHKLVDGPKT